MAKGAAWSRESILRTLEGMGDRRGPLKSKELARAVGVPTAEYRSFRDELRGLVEDGSIVRTRGQRYAVPRSRHQLVGRFRGGRGGRSTVFPADGAGPVDIRRDEDQGAMDGDTVAIVVEGQRRGGRRFGRVVKVLERGRRRLVGRLETRGRGVTVLIPRNPRVRTEVRVATGGPGEVVPGDLVQLELTGYGSRTLPPVGSVVRVLGRAGERAAERVGLLLDHGFDPEFPPEVVAEAEAAVSMGLAEPGPRTDRRDLEIVVIDPSDARDHDDALSITSRGGGRYEVGVHIADVSHFVRPGSALDLEAQRRGNSVYLVGGGTPMLPEALSAGACSLRAAEPRLALSLFFEVDQRGRVGPARVERTWIQVRTLLSYEDAQAALESGDDGSGDTSIGAILGRLRDVAEILRSARLERGSLDFDVPEARVTLDPLGEPSDIQRTLRLETHRLIEDLMVIANEQIASLARSGEWPVLYRVHEPPSPDRLDELAERLAEVGVPFSGRGTAALQRVLEVSRGRADGPMLRRALLRAMSRARYDARNLGHFGLASDAYLHFTSPIRRYADLQVHRAVARGALPLAADVAETRTAESLESLAVHLSDRERAADQAERDSVELATIAFMAGHLGSSLDGTITSVGPAGYEVLLDDYFVEGFVHVSSLSDDFYHLHRRESALIGERHGRVYRMGDPCRVVVARADRETRRIEFVPDGERPR